MKGLSLWAVTNEFVIYRGEEGNFVICGSDGSVGVLAGPLGSFLAHELLSD
jgi:hypothetical protein